MRIAVTVLLVAALAVMAARMVKVESDFAAFLPGSGNDEQRLLVQQLRDGIASRIMLVALEGDGEERLARASGAIAAELAASPQFVFVSNGATATAPGVLDILSRNRYALSPAVTRDSFTSAGLHRSLQDRLAEFSLGAQPRDRLTHDPTGELVAVLKAVSPQTQPSKRRGVWFDAGGTRALLVVQTRSAGFDSVAQAKAAALVREATAHADSSLRVTLAGPGYFAAESHRIIEHDAQWLGAAAIAAVLALLLYVYRSLRAVALVAIPVAAGLIAGILAVQWAFGFVHAITLGFGATLVGEAVDYPNYVLIQSSGGDDGNPSALGGTLAMAVLTTVASALALTLSGFAGLAQLGVLTMVGILVAGAATHWVLPRIAANFPSARPLPAPPWLFPARPRALRIATAAASIVAIVGLAMTSDSWLEHDLANLSPVPARLRALDTQLRGEIGAPDVSHVAISRDVTEQGALTAAGQLQHSLEAARQKGVLRGFDSPAVLLPAEATQRARLGSIPPLAQLSSNLHEALKGLPFKPDAFEPFLADAEGARGGPLVGRATYADTALGAKLDALVVAMGGAFWVLTPVAGISDLPGLEAAVSTAPGTRLADLKRVSVDMLDRYLRESLHQVLLGGAFIAIVLAAGLRSIGRAWRIGLPMLGAIFITAGILVASGTKISIFHVVALLLVLGIGLNYGLFLAAATGDGSRRARNALLLCVTTTVVTFGLLAASSTPVLAQIGTTVALGALVSLLMASAWSAHPSGAEAAT